MRYKKDKKQDKYKMTIEWSQLQQKFNYQNEAGLSFRNSAK